MTALEASLTPNRRRVAARGVDWVTRPKLRCRAEGREGRERGGFCPALSIALGGPTRTHSPTDLETQVELSPHNSNFLLFLLRQEIYRLVIMPVSLTTALGNHHVAVFFFSSSSRHSRGSALEGDVFATGGEKPGARCPIYPIRELFLDRITFRTHHSDSE